MTRNYYFWWANEWVRCYYSKIRYRFFNWIKKEGKTIILSTHIFSLVEKLCDRVGIIFDGRMIKDDSLTNLTKEKSLEDVFFELYDERIGEKYE